MRVWECVSVGVCAVVLTFGIADAQTAARPSIEPIVPSAAFRDAIAAGTRTTTGAPGARYWQNSASYKINARLIPETKRLDGSVEITYRNNSPDTLPILHIDLTQNFHRGDAVRNEAAEVTGGYELRRVVVNNTQLNEDGPQASEGPRYQINGTRLAVLTPQPLLPGRTNTIRIDFAYTIPQAGAGERMGYSRDNFFFMAYWYPQMAVYDDVIGWHPDQFVGTTEFYADWANYEYTIDVPAGWVLVGTGNLVNAQQVLAPEVYQRLQRAEASDQVVNVITRADFNRATAAGTNGRLQWRFVADSMRDVAFSATRASLWDAQRTPVGDRNGDGRPDYARVDALYRESAPLWKDVARYAAHAVAYHSRNTGIPYPWPHMSAVEGEDIMRGGMEYPMMTLIGPYTTRGTQALYAVTSHEIAHMWFPMIVGSDERRYTWMDEGTTAFSENDSEADFWKDSTKFYIEDQDAYLQVARADIEGEIMRRSAFHYSPFAYGVASYDKPASVLVALRQALGKDVFYRAYREYAQRWKYKKPYPWDLFNTFENVSGRDLDWFWRAWYFETWTLDHAVGNVTTSSTGTTVTIQDRGYVPMPVHVTITRANGEMLRREVPVETWLSGATTATVTVPVGAAITRVELDAARAYPDIDRSNNVWRP
ncbi:MAG: M1 family metallopeptidase [Gemmatimonadota bacterium]